MRGEKMIIINEKYYIKTDPLNYVLYKTNDKINEKTGKKMTDALIGYYPNLSCVMDKIINLETNNYCSEDNVHLSDVIKFQKELCDELKQIKLINRE